MQRPATIQRPKTKTTKVSDDILVIMMFLSMMIMMMQLAVAGRLCGMALRLLITTTKWLVLILLLLQLHWNHLLLCNKYWLLHLMNNRKWPFFYILLYSSTLAFSAKAALDKTD